MRADLSRRPYYLRLDLDGDGRLDYVTTLVAGSREASPVVVVCFASGKRIRYNGVHDGILTEEANIATYPVYRALDTAITTEDYSGDGVPIGSEWFEVTRAEIEEAFEYYGVPVDPSDISGEALVSLWPETEIFGFMVDSQFYWVVCAVAAP